MRPPPGITRTYSWSLGLRICRVVTRTGRLVVTAAWAAERYACNSASGSGTPAGAGGSTGAKAARASGGLGAAVSPGDTVDLLIVGLVGSGPAATTAGADSMT